MLLQEIYVVPKINKSVELFMDVWMECAKYSIAIMQLDRMGVSL